MKTLEETGDTGTDSAVLLGVAGEEAENFADVDVAEAHEGVLAPKDGGEKFEIGLGHGVDAADSPTVVADRVSYPVKGLVRLAGIIDSGKRIQIAVVGDLRDLGVAVDTGDALAQREPSHRGNSFAHAHPPALELRRTVDHRFDAEDAAVLVVHLDPVLCHPVLHSRA